VRSGTLPNWSIALLFVLSGAATEVRSVPKAAWSLDEILSAVREVETGGEPDEGRRATGDGGLAIGPFQIHRAYWQDAGIRGAFEDCRDPEYARAVVLAYWRRYCPRALDELEAEVLARVHNGGPRGARLESTLAFWCKVERALEVDRGKP